MAKNKFEIGDIITLKSHPLAFEKSGEMDIYVSQIPPFMCIKEVHTEKKKEIYSSEAPEKKIADNVKYLAVYFNQHRMIFEESFVFHDMVIPIKDIIFHNQNEEFNENHKKLIEETIDYNVASYEFGKRVFFKTYKLEKRKKFKNAGHDVKSTTKTVMTHTSPAFILNGFKHNNQKSIYNSKNGELQRKCADELYKVLWYNSYQEKFSEEYLPKEFFTDDARIFEHITKSKSEKTN
ncbi:MAG: hypothetical protein ACSHXF_09820 [Aquaticitalea sp.]